MDVLLILEWSVLYTTQLTQKSKKYHDGVVRLVQVGSRAKQVNGNAHLVIVYMRILKIGDGEVSMDNDRLIGMRAVYPRVL